MKTILLSILFCMLFSANIKAQTIDATLLETNFWGDSKPRYITKGTSKIYFSADDGIHSRALWVLNTSTNSVNLVKDIYVNSDGSMYYSNFVTINDQLYFIANDEINGNEFWTSDGTEAGTHLVKDINSSGDSSIGTMKVLNGLIYFSANDGINGQELWISDGTTNGTMLLKDLNSGANSSNPTNFFIFDNSMYFICNNGTNGNEIWKSDGTTAGTVILKDINSGIDSGINYGNNFIILDNNFYFFGNDGSTGFELWKSDGTTAGTQLVKDIFFGSNNSSTKLTGSAANNYFVFGATENFTTGNELWISDGTAAGTLLLKDLNSTFSNGITNFAEFATFNNKVYFTGNSNVTGQELWVTNGTATGTQMVKDINNGIYSSNISTLTSTTDFLVFAAIDGTTSYKTLWKSNGTSIGTTKIKDISLSIPSNTDLSFTELNNIIYFPAGYESLNGIELWKTDGTSDNTTLVIDIYHKFGSYYRDFIPFNDKMIFVGTDGINGVEPFITDGTINGTHMIKDIYPGNGNSSMYLDTYARPSLTKAGNNVFFRAAIENSGYELFKTDGTEAGTFLLKDIAPGNTSSIDEETLFMSLNDIVFFKANDQIHGEELWRSDGTTEGTYLLKDINPGTADGITYTNMYYNMEGFISEKCYAFLNGYLYFIGKDNLEYGIWRTDGTTNGTIKVVSIPSNGNNYIRPRILDSANGKIFFKTDTSGQGSGNNTLWSTDGTQAGTTFLGSWLITGPQQFYKNIVFENNFYFTVYSSNGHTLMKSDGTLNGTVAIANPNLNNYESFTSLVSCGNFVYFSIAFDQYNDTRQLWRTDGTLASTTLIEQTPSGFPQYIYDCTCIQNNLFYIKEFYSDKVWYVNDNLESPNFYQINILNSANFPTNYGVYDITDFNGNLLFDGITQESGVELYYADIQNVLSQADYTIENKQNESIKVYPNPTDGKVSLFISDHSKVTNIKLFDILGKNILNLDSANTDLIDLSNFNSGVYFIKVTTETFVETKKIIIK